MAYPILEHILCGCDDVCKYVSHAVFQTTECRVTSHDDGSWPISCTLIDQVEHPSLLTSYPGQYRCTFTLSFGFPPIFEITFGNGILLDMWLRFDMKLLCLSILTFSQSSLKP